MKYVRSFDGLRAVSIIFVLLAHLGLFGLLPQNDFARQRLWPLFSGDTGVTVFFALSGFLITRILLEELRKNAGISLRRFYIRRFLRLLPPLLIFYILVAALMATHRIEASRTSLLFSFFYLYNFVPPGIYITELAHTWSLAVEEQFYFTWPLILALFNSKKAFAVGCFLVALCIVAKFIFPLIMINVDHQSVPITEYYRTSRWFIPAVGPIIIGSLTSIGIAESWGLAEKITANPVFCLSACILLYFSPLYLPSSLLEFAYMFQAMAAALLLAVLLFRRDTLLSTVLGFDPLVYIGKISYGIYVFQGLYLRNGPGGKLMINAFPLNIILTILTAVLSYHLVERRVLRYKEKFR